MGPVTDWAAFLALPARTQRNRALAVMAQIVTEQGIDHIYAVPMPEDRCVYVKDGQPSCLIGRVLARLGLPLDSLRQLDDGSVTGAGTAISQASLGLAPETTEALQRAQTTQDGGETWGLALAAALRSP